MEPVSRLLQKYEYADLFIGKTAFTRIVLKDQEVDSAREGGGETVSCRVIVEGAFGFASGNQPDELRLLLKKAEKLAKAKKGKTRLREPEVNRAKRQGPCKQKPQETAVEDKIRELRELEKLARNRKIFRTEVSYYDALHETVFYNSLGSEILQDEYRTVCAVHAFAKEGKRVESSFDQVKQRGGMEAMKDMPAKLENAVEQALLLLKAKPGPAGKMQALLDPELAGVMAHEAVGHACEADEVQVHGSCLEGKIGKNIGSGNVNISDDATIEGGLWGSYFFDHEGTQARKTELMVNGRLENYLTSLSTANENKSRLSGNARAEPGARPIVRMSNTFFEKGAANVEELFGEVRKGVYLVGCKEGQVSPKTGNFTFAARYGYVIENGEKTKLIKDCSINGNILESLQHVAGVAKDVRFVPGTCGKEGQSVPVTTGSPHLLMESILVG